MEFNKTNQLISGAQAILRIEGHKLNPPIQTMGAFYLLGVNSIEKSIESAKKLPQKNSALLFMRILEIKSMPVPNEFDNETYSFIHRTLFSDIISGAGTLRKANIEKDGSSCIDFKILPSSLTKILSQLQKQKIDVANNRAEFAGILAHFMRELIILSPFKHGSGIVTKLFLELYAYRNGFLLDYSKVSPFEFASAEKTAFIEDNVQPLIRCILKALSLVKLLHPSLRLDTDSGFNKKRLGDKNLHKTSAEATAKTNVSANTAAAKEKTAANSASYGTTAERKEKVYVVPTEKITIEDNPERYNKTVHNNDLRRQFAERAKQRAEARANARNNAQPHNTRPRPARPAFNSSQGNGSNSNTLYNDTASDEKAIVLSDTVEIETAVTITPQTEKTYERIHRRTEDLSAKINAEKAAPAKSTTPPPAQSQSEQKPLSRLEQLILERRKRQENK